MDKHLTTIEPEKLFGLLSDLTRLRCLFLIHKKNELCVCELAYGLEISQPKISRHLALLRKLSLVNTRRTGLWVYYQINPNLDEWIRQTLATSFEKMDSLPQYQRDFERVKDSNKLLEVCNVSSSANCC